MNTGNRRRETRVDVCVPLRFRPMANPNVPTQKAQSVNVSPLGVYFTTDFPLEVGSVLVLWMKMPAQVTSGEARDVRCLARVVHVEPTGRLVRTVGVGLRIELFATVRGIERWAS